jgi:TonB-dependent starch-binding outer membrane protein SusC
MKKVLTNYLCRYEYRLTKLLLFMKVSFVFLFVTLLRITATSYSQDVNLTIDKQGATLREIFSDIESKSNYRFFYNDILTNIDQTVNISAVDEKLNSVLDQLLSESGLTYKILNNNLVVISPKVLLQQRKISGKIIDSTNGEPLPGVNIMVENSTIGTNTNIEGRYSIEVNSDDAVLVFSFIGFNTEKITVTNKSQIDISMIPEMKSLEELVVVGYGTKKKRDLTGSVNSLDNSEITRTKAPNTQAALQGMLTGVDVKKSSGRPGADMTIEIRGANSIGGNTQPLYVLDGVQVSNINDVNPADIERIDILKDASSTAIYGSLGSNGVVIVTTKKGSKGPARITYDAYIGIVNPYNLPRMMNGPEFVDYAREYYKTKNGATTADDKIFSATELTNIANGTYTDWIGLIKQNGLQTNHLLSLTGGDDKTQYFMSAGYQLYEGAIKVENMKKYTLKVGIDKTINDVLKVGASAYSAFIDYNPGSNEVFRSAYRLRPTGSAYNDDGSKRFFTYEGETQITNPLFDLENEIRRKQTIRVFPNIYAEVNLIKNLKFRSSFTTDISFSRTGLYYDTYSKSGAGTKPAGGQYISDHRMNYNLENFLTYNNKIGDHKFDIMAGSTISYYQRDTSSTTVVGLPYRSLWYNVGSVTAITINGTTTQPSTVATSGYSQSSIASFLARANYSFKDRYLLTITGRYDGNSILAEGHKWDFFPSAGVAWVASDENFMRNYSFINLLKFRASVGQSGNATSISPYKTQVNVTQTYYDFNGSTANGFAPSSLGNKSLTWEKTTEYNAGLEVNFLNNRFALQFDYYNKTSKDQIFNKRKIQSMNIFNTAIVNLGSVRNSGIEIGLNTVNIKTKNFMWAMNVNYSKNNNKIVKLYGDGKDDTGNAWFLGKKVRVAYNYKITGVWQDSTAAAVYSQKRGQWKVQDTNKDGSITTADRVIIGSDIPDWFGGITNTFTYKNFDFSFTVYTRQGVVVQSTFLNKFVDDTQLKARFNVLKRDYWTPTNPTNKYANLAIETDDSRKLASEYIDASYTKISNATLGYNFSRVLLSKIKLRSLRLYLTAYNPVIFTDFVGWDPETPNADTGGSQDFRTRTFMFGINVGL